MVSNFIKKVASDITRSVYKPRYKLPVHSGGVSTIKSHASLFKAITDLEMSLSNSFLQIAYTQKEIEDWGSNPKRDYSVVQSRELKLADTAILNIEAGLATLRRAEQLINNLETKLLVDRDTLIDMRNQIEILEVPNFDNKFKR